MQKNKYKHCAQVLGTCIYLKPKIYISISKIYNSGSHFDFWAGPCVCAWTGTFAYMIVREQMILTEN